MRAIARLGAPAAAQSAGVAVSPLLVLAGVGVFLGAADQTSVVTVLPKMIDGIGLPADQFYRAAWIVNGYILGYVVAMPLMGRISDAFGHARMFAAALALFMVGSAWVALSNEITMLSCARALQAVGGGAMVPVAMAIVMATMPPGRRAFGLGAMAAASEAGGLVGPVWGGGIAQIAGWRGVFWINLPLCLPIALLMWRQAGALDSGSRRRIDFAGALLLGASLVCLTIALTDDPIAPRAAAVTAALYAGAAAAFVAFVAWQFREREPLVDLRLFRSVPVSAGILTNGLVGGALIVAMVTVPLFTNVILGGSAIEGGLNLMRLTVALPVGALLGGYLAPKAGTNRVAALAMVLAAAGFLGMSRWGQSPSFLAFTAPLLVTGLGLGLIIAPVNSAVLEHVDQAQHATVSSLLTVMRLVGALVGVALLTTRGLGGFYAQAGLIPLDDPRYIDLVRGVEIGAFHDTFVAAAIVCIGTVVPALFLRPAGQDADAVVAESQA